MLMMSPILIFHFSSLFLSLQLHYNSKMLKTDSPNASRGSSLPRTLSKESKLYGMRDAPAPPASGPGKTNTLLSPPPPPLPSGTKSLHVSSTAAGFLHALSHSLSLTGAWPTLLGSVYYMISSVVTGSAYSFHPGIFSLFLNGVCVSDSTPGL